MAPPKITILLVDDSLVVRHLVAAELAKDPALEVLAPAANGRAALARIATAPPDAVILDVEMPELDGLETLRAIRKAHGALPVIMFSTLTDHGAAATLDALALGANDYVAKPGSANNTAGQIGPVCRELADKIKELCTSSRGPVVAPKLPPRPPPPRLAQPRPAVSRRVGEIVVIAASTGGPNALVELLCGLPPDVPVPFLIAQHMPPVFTRLLADRLAEKAQLPVVEGQAGDLIQPGKVWIAPGDYHMVVQRRGTRLEIGVNQAARENSCRPSADVLFRSAAAVYGPGVVGVVMTGMGQDGLKGCEAISANRGQILAQDEASSVVWGMPGFVARAGLADAVVPLADLADQIMSRVRRPAAESVREVTRGSL